MGEQALRDQIAIAAIQGFCSSKYYETISNKEWARRAYEQADAMIKEREKKEDELS